MTRVFNVLPHNATKKKIMEFMIAKDTKVVE